MGLARRGLGWVRLGYALPLHGVALDGLDLVEWVHLQEKPNKKSSWRKKMSRSRRSMHPIGRVHFVHFVHFICFVCLFKKESKVPTWNATLLNLWMPLIQRSRLGCTANQRAKVTNAEKVNIGRLKRLSENDRKCDNAIR